ncbi:flippase-like domain-containing protein, partial [bacterium]|nr:flippase-like domain-containing protein [bacterium]
FPMPLWVSPALRARYGVLAAALSLPLLVLVHPRSFSWLLNRGLRLLKREPLAVRLTWGQLARLLGLSALMWVGMGAAFAMFARSLWPAVAWSDAGILAGAYALAWTLGLASVVSPGGLGVREAVLLALLGGPLAPAGALVVAIGSRVWVTVAELAFAGVALLLPPRTE